MAEPMTFTNYFRGVFKAQHLDSMDEWRKAQYYKLRGKEETGRFNTKNGEWVWLEDNRSKEQQKWENKATGKLATEWPEDRNAYNAASGAVESAPENMDRADWERFYRICRRTFRAIYANRKELARKLPPGEPMVADQFIGSESFKAFSITKLNPESTDAVSKLADLMLGDSRLKLRFSKDRGNNKIFDAEVYSVDTFLGDLKRDKASTDIKVKQKLTEVLDTVSGIFEVEGSGLDTDINKDIRKELLKAFPKGADSLDLLIADVNGDNDEPPKEEELRNFMDPKSTSGYKELLKKLYDPAKENRESAFFGQFKEYNGREITDIMAEQISEIAYETGDNAIQPLFEEQFNTIEKIKDVWGDWRDEHLKRFYSRSARHIYTENSAAGIVTALEKEKISPTDGVLKWVEKKKEIRDRIQKAAPGSLPGFDFLIKALEHIKGGAKSDNVLKGALKNGKKCSALAMEIMKFAASQTTDRLKEQEAKAALEVLAVMRYDTFSSAHGPALWKEKFDPFKEASFMKNEGVKFVLNAATGALHLGINGLYWAGVMGRNLIQHARGRIDVPLSERDEKIFKTALEQIEKQCEAFRDPRQAKKEWKERKTALMKSETENFDILKKRKRYDELTKDIEDARNKVGVTGQLAKGIVRRKKIKKILETRATEVREIDKKIKIAQKKAEKIQKLVDQLTRKIENDSTPPDEFRALQSELKTQTKQLKDASTEIKTLELEKEKLGAPANANKRKSAGLDFARTRDSEKPDGAIKDIENYEKSDTERKKEQLEQFQKDAMKEMDPDDLYETFGAEGLETELERLDEIINTTNETRRLNVKLLEKESNDIADKEVELEELKNFFGFPRDLKKGTEPTEEQKEIQKKLDDHTNLIAETNYAQELYERVQGIEDRNIKKEVEDKPAMVPGLSKKQQVDMLMEFWNVVNGYNNDYDVSSFWSLRNIKEVRKEANLSRDFTANRPWEDGGR